METDNWKRQFRINIMVLKIVGLWPPGDSSYKLDLYTVYSITSLTVFIVGFNLSQTLSIFLLENDLQSIVSTVFSSITLCLSILKSYFLVLNMPLLKQLMMTIESDMFQVKNSREKQLKEINSRLWEKMYNLYYSLSMITVFFWMSVPFFNLKERILPIAAWFPFDYKISPFYELTYFYQFMGLCFICAVNINTDTLIAALNMFVGAQCDILCDKLRHIHEFVDINEGLKDCVKHHRAIVRFAKNSNIFFNWIILWQFFASIVSLAMTMFELSVIPGFRSDFYTYVTYGVAVLVQLFLYCWFGNQVELKSNNLPYAVFESDWTNSSLEVKKNMVLIILRTQKPIKVSALNLFYLSLETFIMIVRSSMSYFAVLRQINGEE